jgi:hypothetical protein
MCPVLEAGNFFTWIFSPIVLHINDVALYHLSYPDFSGAGLEPATFDSYRSNQLNFPDHFEGGSRTLVL